MAKNINHITHIKSNIVSDGKPKLPLSDALVEGEIAINYAEGYETISIKDSNGNIKTFSSDNYYTEQKLGTAFTSGNSAVTVTEYLEDIEEVIAAAFNDLDTKKLDESAYTPVDLSGYYTKTNIDEKLGSAFTGVNSANTVTDVIDANELAVSTALEYLDANKLDESAYTPVDLSDYYTKIDIDDKLGSAFTSGNSGVTITEYIDEIENVAATAINDLNNRKLDASAYTPTDLTNYYTKVETDNKLGSAFTDANSAVTVTDYLDEIDIVISEALVDLDKRKLDVSAYTPTDLTNYYTKSQTSGASEISSALQDKQDVSGMSAYTTSVDFDDKLGSAFTGANSAVTVTEALNNVNIEVDQVIDSGTSASTHAVATQAVYDVIADNELVWTNAYVVVSGAIHSHTANTSIHGINTVSKVDVSDNTSVSCPSSITGAANDGAQAVVIYENTGTTIDYTVTVNSTYKTPNGSQLILTCPKNGFCKVTYININGTIYASGN